MFGACAPVVLASNVCPTSIALDKTSVYFTHDTIACSGPPGPGSCSGTWAVRKVPKTGGSTVSIASETYDPLVHPVTVADAVAVFGGSVYWVEWQQLLVRLMQVPAIGGTPAQLGSDSNEVPRQVTRNVGANANGVFWADEERGVVRFTGGSGSILTPSLFFHGGSAGAPYPSTLAVDGLNAYFTSNDPPTMSENLLNSVPIGGGSITTIGSEGDLLHRPVPLADTAIATDGTNVYWTTTDQAPGAILRVPVAGGAQTIFGGTLNPDTTVTSLAVDPSGLYWTENESSGRISGQALTGGVARALAGGQSYPLAIASDDTSVYWVNAGVSFSTTSNLPIPSSCTGSVMKVAK